MNTSRQISLKLIKLNRFNHWSTVYVMDEELTVRTLECHDIDYAEKWKKGF